MARYESNYRALNGGRLHLSSDHEPAGTATSVVVAEIGGHQHEFSAGEFTQGERNLGDAIASALGVSAFTEEFSYKGGRLRIGEAREVDTSGGANVVDELMLATWDNGHSALVTPAYGVSIRELVRVLDRFEFVEHDDGLELRPLSSRDASFVPPPVVAFEVPGVGLIECAELSSDIVATLPPWEGTQLNSGELFIDYFGNGNPYYVLASESVRATVLPFDPTGEEELLHRLSEISLTWE